MPRKTKFTEIHPERFKAAQTAYNEAQAARASGDLKAMADRLNDLGEILNKAPSTALKDLPSLSVLDPVVWDEQHTTAAIALAEGKTQAEAGEEVGVTGRTVRNWLQNNDFRAEVDRLSLMLGIASRAERLRLAQRVISQKLVGNKIQTDKDVLEWLKFAQSETDGVKLDLGKLAAAFGADDSPLAAGRQAGTGGETESEAVN